MILLSKKIEKGILMMNHHTRNTKRKAVGKTKNTDEKVNEDQQDSSSKKNNNKKNSNNNNNNNNNKTKQVQKQDEETKSKKPPPSLSSPSPSQLPITTTTRPKKYLPKDFLPGPWDVICQRGGENFNHVGNQKFRIVIQQYLDQYKEATTKQEKSIVVSTVVEVIRKKTGNTSGFIKKDLLEGRWYEVGDKLARDKVGQALRDGVKHSEEQLLPQSQSPTAAAAAAAKLNKKHDILGLDFGGRLQQHQQGEMIMGSSSIHSSFPLAGSPAAGLCRSSSTAAADADFATNNNNNMGGSGAMVAAGMVSDETGQSPTKRAKRQKLETEEHSSILGVGNQQGSQNDFISPSIITSGDAGSTTNMPTVKELCSRPMVAATDHQFRNNSSSSGDIGGGGGGGGSNAVAGFASRENTMLGPRSIPSTTTNVLGTSPAAGSASSYRNSSSSITDALAFYRQAARFPSAGGGDDSNLAMFLPNYNNFMFRSYGEGNQQGNLQQQQQQQQQQALMQQIKGEYFNVLPSQNRRDEESLQNRFSRTSFLMGNASALQNLMGINSSNHQQQTLSFLLSGEMATPTPTTTTTTAGVQQQSIHESVDGISNFSNRAIASSPPALARISRIATNTGVIDRVKTSASPTSDTARSVPQEFGNSTTNRSSILGRRDIVCENQTSSSLLFHGEDTGTTMLTRTHLPSSRSIGSGDSVSSSSRSSSSSGAGGNNLTTLGNQEDVEDHLDLDERQQHPLPQHPEWTETDLEPNPIFYPSEVNEKELGE